LVNSSTAKNGVDMSLEYLVDEKSIDQTSVELTGWANPLARLREALEKDEFALYCQPVAAVQAGGARFPMAEVLVRMREEERALLPPGEFLPVFEHYGMMPTLDRWVLRHTVQQFAGGSRIPRFTINVSGQTLKDATFPAYAAAELRAAGVAMDAVMFELDESDVLARPEPSASFAAAVQAYGGGVVIDSFCRRAVSFAPFKALRPAFVKVDGSLIRKLIVSEAAQTKLKAVVRVADALGMGVVAEGVEEQDLLARLKALGVGFAQGFGVAKPQPIESFSAKP
jgi:EAL domain-containing protein (putative c-di-GMP-specific phosphodiesterase class I)